MLGARLTPLRGAAAALLLAAAWLGLERTGRPSTSAPRSCTTARRAPPAGGRGPRGACRGPAPAAPASRPSIVVILTDDERANTLSALPRVRGLLVAHGVRFANAFVSDPLCCPSRATVLTGDYAHTTRIWANGRRHGGGFDFHRFGDDRSTLATWLHAAGYRTGLFGKYLNYYGGRYVPPGWDDWAAFDYAVRYNDFVLVRPHRPGCRGLHGCLVGYRGTSYSTSVLGDLAARFVETTPRSRPLFLYYAPFAPHEPARAEPRYRHAFRSLRPYSAPSLNEADVRDKPRYVRRLPLLRGAHLARVQNLRRDELATLLSVDDAVGKIVSALARTGRLGNTLILYSSDNAVMWGEHRLAAGLKGVPYDEATRVPLVVRYDPWTHRPRTERRLVSNVDWAPTLAVLAGVRHPRVEGRSFLPLLRRAHAPSHESVLLESWHFGRRAPAPSFCGLRSARWLYVRYETGEQELYDARRDPFELRNLAARRPRPPALAPLRRRTLARCTPPPPGYATPAPG